MTRSAVNEKGVNIYLVYVYCGLGDLTKAKYWLTKARMTNDVDLIWLGVDPMLKDLGQTVNVGEPDFEGAEKHILTLLQEQMPNLTYHNLAHVQDVLQAAMLIAEQERVGEEEVKIIRLAALLHDIGFIYAAKNHEEKGAELTRELLPAFGFSKDTIEIIYNMIVATRLPQSPTTQLEKILCDADLDYLGRDDFYEIGVKLFEEMKAGGAVEDEREWNLVQRTFLQSHRFHTAFSKANREEAKNVRLSELTEKLKRRS